MKICLDTSAYSRLAQQHTELVKCVDEAETVFLPCIMLGELFAGFGLGRREKENRKELADFLDLPGVRVVDIDASIAIDIEGIKVQIPSLADLIRNKRASGRTQDIADAEALAELRQSE